MKLQTKPQTGFKIIWTYKQMVIQVRNENLRILDHSMRSGCWNNKLYTDMKESLEKLIKIEQRF